MLKILKNLKESFWQVVIIVVLLCVQAAIDLALPDFTSKIVNIGIQEGKNDYILVKFKAVQYKGNYEDRR